MLNKIHLKQSISIKNDLMRVQIVEKMFQLKVISRQKSINLSHLIKRNLTFTFYRT